MGLAEYLKLLSSTYPNIAYVYASVGHCCMAFMQIAFKYVTQTVSPFQALFMRAFSLFLLNCYILRQANESPYIGSPFGTRLPTQSLGRWSSGLCSLPATLYLLTIVSNICLSAQWYPLAMLALSSSSSLKPSITAYFYGHSALI